MSEAASTGPQGDLEPTGAPDPDAVVPVGLVERRRGPAYAGQVAIFDLDRTLVAGSSLMLLGRELVRRGLVPSRLVARHCVTHALFEWRGLRDERVERLAAGLLSAASGMEHAPLADVAHDVGRVVAGRVHRGARWMLDRHLVAGDFCVVLSAAPQELVESVVTALGAHRAVGTRLEVVGGRLTGRLDGPFCYGPGKVHRLEQELGRFDLAGATAYADAESDLSLLRRCGAAVAVNPDAGLRRVADGAGWPVVRWGDRRAERRADRRRDPLRPDRPATDPADHHG